MDDRKVTLRDVVSAVREFARTDEEVVATITHLVNSGRVRFQGALSGAQIRLDARRTAPRAAAAHA